MVKRKYGIRYAEYVYVRKLVPFDITDITARADEFETKGFVPKLSGYTNYSGESLDLYLWGLRLLRLKMLGIMDTKAKVLIIAVLDTGVDGTHPDLQGQVVEGYRPSTDEILPEGIDSSLEVHMGHTWQVRLLQNLMEKELQAWRQARK